MKPKVTNIRATTIAPVLEDSTLVSRVIIESTLPPLRHTVRRVNSKGVIVILSGFGLTPPEGTVPVYDGLISEIVLTRSGPDEVSVDIHLEHPAEVQTSLEVGMPSRLTVRLDRAYLKGIMTGRVILVDPGHGGNDPGASGPTKVLEKNAVLDVGRRLTSAVRAMGGEAVLTRDEDRDVTRGIRFRQAHEGRVDCLVSLHLGAPGTRNIRGTKTLYLPSHPESPTLAGHIQEALVQKLKLNDRGVARDGKYFGDLPVPAIATELVCLHNPVDEALLRSWIFRERLAQCLSRGLKNFFLLARNGRKDVHRANGPHYEGSGYLNDVETANYRRSGHRDIPTGDEGASHGLKEQRDFPKGGGR